MKKINLLKQVKNQKSKGGRIKSHFSFDFMSAEADIPNVSFFSLLPKLGFVFLFVFSLRVYEAANLEKIRGENEIIQKEFNRLDLSYQTLKKANEKFKQGKEDAKKLQIKITALAEIAKDRLHEIKALDLLESLVPDEIWLEHVDYKNDKKLFVFKGFGELDESVNAFVLKLEKSLYFQNVTLISSIEKKTGTVSVKAFEIRTDTKEDL